MEKMEKMNSKEDKTILNKTLQIMLEHFIELIMGYIE
jgi:hypothetical protein